MLISWFPSFWYYTHSVGLQNISGDSGARSGMGPKRESYGFIQRSPDNSTAGSSTSGGHAPHDQGVFLAELCQFENGQVASPVAHHMITKYYKREKLRTFDRQGCEPLTNRKIFQGGPTPSIRTHSSQLSPSFCLTEIPNLMCVVLFLQFCNILPFSALVGESDSLWEHLNNSPGLYLDHLESLGCL